MMDDRFVKEWLFWYFQNCKINASKVTAYRAFLLAFPDQEEDENSVHRINNLIEEMKMDGTIVSTWDGLITKLDIL